MGVEAARPLVRAGAEPGHLWFSTTEPAYADRTNATAIHAALRLPAATTAIDMNGSVRSAVGALRVALEGSDRIKPFRAGDVHLVPEPPAEAAP